MSEWIPFEEGEYWVENAYLVALDQSAVALEAPVIAVGKTPQGKRYLKGQGMVRNLLVVELLEDDDRLDVLLDLGGDFKYHLEAPRISAGKLFVPDAKSTLQFAPLKPWRRLSPEDYQNRVKTLKRLDD